jgi:transcription elongation factor SPT5
MIKDNCSKLKEKFLSFFRFLYKNFKMNAIVTERVKPTIEEIEKFEENPENINIELSSMSGFVDNKEDLLVTHHFYTGDNVEVCRGELIHLQGKILSIHGNKIMILPNHKELTEPIDFMASELKKYFNIGNHVKVSFLDNKIECICVYTCENKLIYRWWVVNMKEIQV